MLLCMIVDYCMCKVTYQDVPLAVSPGQLLVLQEMQWMQKGELHKKLKIVLNLLHLHSLLQGWLFGSVLGVTTGIGEV